MKRFFMLLSLAALTITSCKDEAADSPEHNKAEKNVMTTSKPVLDNSLVGTYTGQTPCATCEAIQTSIILREDNTYAISTKAVNDTGLLLPLVDSGHFVIQHNVLELTDQGGESVFYKMGKDTLLQLADDGSVLNTANTSNYIFIKQH
ncbi:hypothetical protein DBR32_07015 [Taibaiella sp. KBW10]|uniref:copper resistance protein NlpE n=1 Tax=Taibaiella sp. KBW10 TaxID=2153357 RepID=UPI000F5A98C5|nr:copper resistance protein NlpE N-terminal domain-containing protein [Taibaiella sp. KBW10]RQO31690.1 hypothetical protein DBR32_07015 [Taibaiella sp. KBW10]